MIIFYDFVIIKIVRLLDRNKQLKAKILTIRFNLDNKWCWQTAFICFLNISNDTNIRNWYFEIETCQII
jgi:hypothetical protein